MIKLNFTKSPNFLAWMVVLVTTLGYFVDGYDIFIFTAVRVQSLKELGVSADRLMDVGITILNVQLVGMLLGGFAFGIFGDKFGRKQAMFASILIYSIATLANAFVHSVEAYTILRFIAGVGLAGELGLGATLIAETLPKEKRNYGLALLLSLGGLGAVAAGFASKTFDWRTCYLIGGSAGLVLLLLRSLVMESSIFQKIPHGVAKGQLRLLFQSPSGVARFLCCLSLALPIWFVISVLIIFSTEITQALGGAVVSTPTLMVIALPLTALGDLICILLSHRLGSRRLVCGAWLAISLAACSFLFFSPWPLSDLAIKLTYMVICFGAGAWVFMAVVATELFGTNLRATATTVLTNLARATAIPMTLSLSLLKGYMPMLDAILIVGAFAFGLPLMALFFLPETHGRSLDFLEIKKQELRQDKPVDQKLAA
jgi:MFS family permease